MWTWITLIFGPIQLLSVTFPVSYYYYYKCLDTQTENNINDKLLFRRSLRQTEISHPLNTRSYYLYLWCIYSVTADDETASARTNTHPCTCRSTHCMQTHVEHTHTHTHTHKHTHTYTHTRIHTDPFSNHIHVSSSLFSYFGVHYRESSSLLPPFQTRCE